MLDLVISGGRIIDGAGNPWFRADLGIKDGRIVAVGTVEQEAARTIPVADLAVCPGFVDIHSHADFVLPLGRLT